MKTVILGEGCVNLIDSGIATVNVCSVTMNDSHWPLAADIKTGILGGGGGENSHNKKK